METAIHLKITPFNPENQEAVKNLILQGLGEHWGTVDPTKNPDLKDIAQTYAKDIFLVAWHQDQIIGSGALVQRGPDKAEIVRMSVLKSYRRMGVGQKILDSLCGHAKMRGFKTVILETTETWQEVIQFYRAYGFHITHHKAGDVYFSLAIASML